MRFKAFNQMVVFSKDYVIYTGIVDFYFNVFTFSSIIVKSEGQMRTVVDFSDYSELDYSKVSVDDYSYLDASDNLIIKFTKNAG